VSWALRQARPAGRDEHWTGLGLDWIRTLVHSVKFGLDLGYKSLQNLWTGPDLDWVNGKEMQHFCCEKAAFFKFYGLNLDLDHTFEKNLDCGWTWTEFKKSGLDLDRKIWQSAHLCRQVNFKKRFVHGDDFLQERDGQRFWCWVASWRERVIQHFDGVL